MSATHERQHSQESNGAGRLRDVGRTHTESLAWAMFVAGYDARIEDTTNETRFLTRESFDEHLYEQFRTIYDRA